jgi:hypothetical protein
MKCLLTHYVPPTNIFYKALHLTKLKKLKKEQMKALSKIIDADNHINEDWDTTK